VRHFFDIGANAGQTFDDYLCKGGGFDGATIWCFEPSPRHLGALHEKCELMSRTDHNWRINICSFGLLDRTGWTRVFEKRDPRGDSIFPELYLGNQYIENRETSLGTFCQTHDIVDFIMSNVVTPDTVTIKIDTEGSEFKIVKRILGASEVWPLIEKLMVEWHGVGAVNGQHDEAVELEKRAKECGVSMEGWPY